MSYSCNFVVLHIIMHKTYIHTPVGSCLIEGDESGVSKIWVLDEAVAVSKTIPEPLKDAVAQLEEYFAGSRKDFDFKINPQGTPFQKKSMGRPA